MVQNCGVEGLQDYVEVTALVFPLKEPIQGDRARGEG